VPPNLPPNPAAHATDLTDAEFAMLGERLAAAPAPLEPMGAVTLDGYLCGVLVQPFVVEPARWLPPVFDPHGRAQELAVAAWSAGATELILRRHAALNRAIVEDGWFEPFILGFDDEHPIAVSEYEPLACLPPASQALAPWVEGFREAVERFGALAALGEPAIDEALARLYRHLSPPAQAARPLPPPIEADDPLAGLDAAIDELVAAVVDIADLTIERRYRVETVRRAAPKVGRNDPCPCGSGRKFKQCHGAG
jgi:uncharacterized protein